MNTQAIKELSTQETAEHQHVAHWDLHPELGELIKNGEVALGTMIGAGHMPKDLVPDIVNQAGIKYKKDPETNFYKMEEEDITPRQLAKLILLEQVRMLSNQLRNRIPLIGSKPFRALDPERNINSQRQEIYQELRQSYEEGIKTGKKAVMFSVCAFSAYFDSNYYEAMKQLIDEVNEENTNLPEEERKRVIFSIFTPFNKDDVESFSSPHGLNAERYVNNWKKLMELSEDKDYKHNIFIHEPKAEDGHILTEKEASARGAELGDPNLIYSEVNWEMLYTAWQIAGGDVTKMHGIFGETFLGSNAFVGGAPEVIALMLYLGVSIENIYPLLKGLTFVTLPRLMEGIYKKIDELGSSDLSSLLSQKALEEHAHIDIEGIRQHELGAIIDLVDNMEETVINQIIDDIQGSVTQEDLKAQALAIAKRDFFPRFDKMVEEGKIDQNWLEMLKAGKTAQGR